MVRCDDDDDDDLGLRAPQLNGYMAPMVRCGGMQSVV